MNEERLYILGIQIQKYATMADDKSTVKHAIVRHNGMDQLTRRNTMVLRHPAPLYLEEEIRRWKELFPRKNVVGGPPATTN